MISYKYLKPKEFESALKKVRNIKSSLDKTISSTQNYSNGYDAMRALNEVQTTESLPEDSEAFLEEFIIKSMDKNEEEITFYNVLQNLYQAREGIDKMFNDMEAYNKQIQETKLAEQAKQNNSPTDNPYGGSEQ